MTSQPGGEPPSPVRVGDYTLLARIGEGGMGVVHLARRPDGSRVALKVLRQHIVGDAEARQRLAREVSSLRRVRSKWCAEILDADPYADVPYVATRYVPGLSLHDHVVQEGPIEGTDLLWFAGCLAEGLAAVHAAGVLHRDVKPSNVLMEGRTPILIDFGLARVADDPRLTHTGWLLGTPGYLAPEILYGDDATPAADLHSWGATVAYAATGRPPFGRGPSMAIMDRVRRGQVDLDGFTGPLRDLVAAVLDPEPERRPTLDAVLAWLGPQTTRPTPLLGAPPVVAGPPAEVEDVFTAPLALAALGNLPRRGAPPGHPDDEIDDADAPTRAAPTWVDHAPPARPTQVLPEQPRVDVVPPAAVRPPPYVPTGYDDRPQPDPYAWPAEGLPAPEPVSFAERARRFGLLLSTALAVSTLGTLAPWVTLAVVLLAVWVVRSGSIAASAAAGRREVRGRRWYDGPQVLLHAPWHVVASIPGTVMLVLWSAGLAAAAALVCYAVATTLPLALFVCGATFSTSLWWGPGGSRVRSPLARVVHPLSRRPVVWLVAVLLVLLVAAAAGLVVEARGVAWVPFADRPFA